MVWKLDNIDFSEYGVFVKSSSGVLDIPAIVDKSNNWLDKNGREFWQDIESTKFQDREIVLTCWLLADDYEDLKSKAQAFYSALSGTGKRTLSTPYGIDIDCFLKDQIQLTRYGSYVKAIQMGFFNLKLTVEGDPDAILLNITRYYTTNVIAVVKTTDLKINKTLQGDSYASFSFESNKKLDIKYFDEINLNTNGIQKDRFYFEAEPEVKELASNKFQYSVKAMHLQNWLSYTDFLNDLGETDFSYYANMDEIMDLLLNNHGRDFYNRKFLKGTIDATDRKLHKFNGEKCLAVLKRLATEYKLEYEFVFDNVTNWQYRINVKAQVATDKEVTLEPGKGNGLLEFSRGEMLTEELVTVLHAFGAARNLKPDYRNGLRRLSFDGNPIQMNYGFDFEAGQWGVHSKAMTFDEIYPRRTATVESYVQKLPAELSESEKYAHPEGIFKIIDSTIDFNINDYLLNGLTAKVAMKTGDLAGMEFEINRYDNDTKEIYLIPFKDERGDLYPTAVLTIKAGDTYTLVDIDQPAAYVAAAEAELLAAATEYITERCVPKYPYRAVVDPAWIKSQPQPFGFEVGDRVTFVSERFNLNGPLRIINLMFYAYKGTYELTLSEVVRIPKLKKTEMRLESIERSMAAAKKDTTETTRKDQETTNELRNRILDPTDDKLAANRVIRTESLDPGMLAFDAGVPQWSVKNALIEPNVDGNEDKVNVGAGHLIISNFYTLDRYAIQKLKDNGQVYDPTRTWEIPATAVMLPTKEAYFIYAKLTLAEGSTACQILAYPEHVEMKLTPGYLYIKMAGISSGEEGTV